MYYYLTNMEQFISGKQITTKMGEPLILVNADGIAGVSDLHALHCFGPLAEHITTTYQADMLPKSPEDLLKRLRERRLVAAMPKSEVQASLQEFCASCNIDPLFSQEIFYKYFGSLQIDKTEKIPTVIELGGVIVDPTWQGHGIGERMAYFMLHELADQIRSGDVLVVLTTKHAAMMLTVLPKIGISEDEIKGFLNGLGFRPYVHDDPNIRMIGALTCTCEEPLGLGYGYPSSLTQRCSRRVSELPSDINAYRRSLTEILGETNGGHIPCTMAVSSSIHAPQFSKRIEEVIGQVSNNPFDHFIYTLRVHGYYGEHLSRRRQPNDTGCGC